MHLRPSIAASLGVPSDITVWNTGHVLAALLQGDSTQAGDLVVGERALADLFWSATLSDPAIAAEIGDFATQVVQEIQRMAARF